MNAIGDVLRFLSAGLLGVYAGAMITEGFFLVSYWRSLVPQEFLAWYGANDRRLIAFFQPLTTWTALIALAAALVSLWTGHPARWPALIAAVLTLVAVATYFVYFQSTNASFAAGTIALDAVPAELARWAAWHWVRTTLSVLALVAALVCLRRAG